MAKEADSTTEKKRIKSLKEHLQYLRESYSSFSQEEDNDFVKVFVAERNSKGHLQNLGSFKIFHDQIQWLEEELKQRYGKGCYCVSLQQGSWRSQGVDILIETGLRRRKPKPDFKDAKESPKSKKDERISFWLEKCLPVWWHSLKGIPGTKEMRTTFDFISAVEYIKERLEALQPDEIAIIKPNDVYHLLETYLKQQCSPAEQLEGQSDELNLKEEIDALSEMVGEIKEEIEHDQQEQSEQNLLLLVYGIFMLLLLAQQPGQILESLKPTAEGDLKQPQNQTQNATIPAAQPKPSRNVSLIPINLDVDDAVKSIV
ncbi:MAG: hypothetical protein ACE5GN_00290 [Waddliaceae bacterium]